MILLFLGDTNKKPGDDPVKIEVDEKSSDEDKVQKAASGLLEPLKKDKKKAKKAVSTADIFGGPAKPNTKNKDPAKNNKKKVQKAVSAADIFGIPKKEKKKVQKAFSAADIFGGPAKTNKKNKDSAKLTSLPSNSNASLAGAPMIGKQTMSLTSAPSLSSLTSAPSLSSLTYVREPLTGPSKKSIKKKKQQMDIDSILGAF